MKYDELLSYIGGLFGLIALVVGVPLHYYNVCCYELSLATNMFTYKRMDEEDGEEEGDKEEGNKEEGSHDKGNKDKEMK